MKPALEDVDFLAVRDYCLDPDNCNQLTEQQTNRLNRIRSASKLYNKYPFKKQVVNLLRATYQISESQARKDIEDSLFIFNLEHKFNFEWWHNWALENIAELILSCKNASDRSNWAKAQKNLIAALGDPPKQSIDPRLMEKHNMFIVINVNNHPVNIDIKDLGKYPPEFIEAIKPTLFEDITEDTAAEIMNT